MKKTTLFILALSGIFASAQEVTWRLVREGNYQTENKVEIPGNEQGSTAPKIEHSKIEWINDCTFRLTYDESKSVLTVAQKYINQINGILMEVINIEGNCFTYKSTMTVNGKNVVREGKMYKQ